MGANCSATVDAGIREKNMTIRKQDFGQEGVDKGFARQLSACSLRVGLLIGKSPLMMQGRHRERHRAPPPAITRRSHSEALGVGDVFCLVKSPAGRYRSAWGRRILSTE